MLFGKFIDELGIRLKIDANDPATRVIFSSKINQSYKEIGRSHEWEHLKRTSEIRTIANYTTGTVTITKDSRTVTGSGTTFTVAMEGRYFQPAGSTNWYRIIKFVDASTLTLQVPIIEASASGITYIIWKRFYYLHSNVRKIMEFGDWVVNGQLVETSNVFQSDRTPNLSITGTPLNLSIYGVDPFESSYSTGTISVTKDTDTATGTGTSFLDNVEQGDILTVGNQEYRIKRVESDTVLRLHQNVLATNSTTYTIKKDNPIGIQFYPQSDKAYIFPYTFIKRVYDMLNEANDRPEFPEDFDNCILDGAEANRMRDLDDKKWQLKFQEYQLRLRELKAKNSVLGQPRIRQFVPVIPARSNY